MYDNSRGAVSVAFVATLLAVALVPSVARAHALKPAERALVQFGADATEILYEASIPAGKDAARWRLVADADRNGRLSDAELSGLAKTLAEAIAKNLAVTLDGNALPVTVLDAKLSDAPSPDRLSGRLSVLAFLQVRALPAGTRKTTWSVKPLVGGGKPVVLRFEGAVDGFRVESLAGGGRVALADGTPAVSLRGGETATLLVVIPVAAAKPGARSP